MQRVSPFLWFDKEAEEAARFYVSIFKNSRITQILRYPSAGPGPAGSVWTVAFELDGLPFGAVNGGPLFPFTEAVSFVVTCETQGEIDQYWERLCEGGKPVQCGWLKDKFGLSWQIVPANLPALLGGDDPVKAKRATEAMLKMVKLDIDALRRAREG
jgi:predicted 3-demethylubiquinone-9 3-methyltransferase (glyoxalase superfamily)